jgi:hypothetical protein
MFMLVVDLLCQTPGAEEYRAFFALNYREISQLANSKKKSLRDLAASILSQLSIVEVGNLLGADDGGSIMASNLRPQPSYTQTTSGSKAIGLSPCSFLF